MSHFTPNRLAEYRDYLRLLINPRIDPRLGAKVDASDVVQDAMYRAHQAFGQFRGTTEQEFVAWLRSILKTALLDALRRFSQDKHNYRLEQSIHDALNNSSLRFDQLLANSGTSPSGAVAKREQAAQLAVALALLPDGQRTAVDLHHLQGLSLIETATEMGRTSVAVAGLVRRGLIALKKQVKA